jgi:hypothetical protein
MQKAAAREMRYPSGQRQWMSWSRHERHLVRTHIDLARGRSLSIAIWADEPRNLPNQRGNVDFNIQARDLPPRVGERTASSNLLRRRIAAHASTGHPDCRNAWDLQTPRSRAHSSAKVPRAGSIFIGSSFQRFSTWPRDSWGFLPLK